MFSKNLLNLFDLFLERKHFTIEKAERVSDLKTLLNL